MNKLITLGLFFVFVVGAIAGDAINSANALAVPKTLAALQKQTGSQFLTAQRGPLLIASNLPYQQFEFAVNGIIACAQSALNGRFFTKTPTQPITIYIFNNKESYLGGLNNFFALDPISPYGHYGHRQRYIVVNYQTGPGTLVHELVHALMAPDFPEAPIWISEGLASLYEQCRVENNRLIGEANWRLPELQTALAQQKLTPLAQLFASDTQNFRLMNESLHYSQSRYFCLFLQELDLLEKVYHEFRDTVAFDRFGIQAVERAFNRPLVEIEQDWHLWIKRQVWEKK